MPPNILAIHTYGSHRVKDPQTQETVSAHKIGYTSAAADLLLALYGDNARDVSSSRTSYRYIHITAETTVRYGYLPLIRVLVSTRALAMETALSAVRSCSRIFVSSLVSDLAYNIREIALICLSFGE